VRIVAGDLGGTNTRLQIATCAGGTCRIERSQQYPSQAFPDFDSILSRFLEGESRPPVTACLAVAGPVHPVEQGEQVKVTNLPWLLDSRALVSRFGIARIRLINDFQAIGFGIEHLPTNSLDTLQDGSPVTGGTRAVLGAGTGLGQTILVPRGSAYEVLATEGGHVDFGPTSELELELARWLLRSRGRASYEDILSGPGLYHLYSFLRDRQPAKESAGLAEELRTGDPAAVITRAALDQEDALAAETVDLFVRIYGAQAGNLALAAGATGGVYLAGGIAPRIVSRLHSTSFLEAFRNKGNHRDWMVTIPIRVVMDPGVGLLGAMAVAQRLISTEPA